MPTDKPSVMAYIEPGLYKQLVALKEKRGTRSLSQVVEDILKEYFGDVISSTLSHSIFLEQQRLLVQQITWLVENYQILQETVMDLQRVIHSVVTTSSSESIQKRLVSQEIKANQVAHQLIQQKRSELTKNSRSPEVLKEKESSLRLTFEQIKQGLTGVQLATRLKIHSSNLSRRRAKSNFTEWTQRLDVDGIGWVYNGFARRFYPANILENSRKNIDAESE